MPYSFIKEVTNIIHNDLFYDIAIGITSIQMLDIDGEMRLGNKHNIKPKTDILDFIHNITIPYICEINKNNEWKYESEFITDENSHIQIIDYPTWGDGCIISLDHNSPIKVNKRWVNTLYGNK